MLHSSTLAWGYLLLIGGIVILAIGIAGLIHGARSSRSPEELLLRRRMRMLAALMQAGQISREEYNRRRTEILVQQYKKHAA